MIHHQWVTTIYLQNIYYIFFLRNGLGQTVGLKALSKALCDTSSLDGIRKSNHTLYEIVVNHADSLPLNNEKLLKLNRSDTSSEVVCLKIIEYFDNITIKSPVNDQPTMQTKLVPDVISWLVKDGSKHSALYHFV